MEIVNLSAEPLGKLHSWLPRKLAAEKVVFLPDACPGKSPLPTGVAVFTQQPDWRKYAVSDCGCGMRLLQSDFGREKLTQKSWDKLADAISANKGGLGDLGGGNHFLDALIAEDGGPVHFLIHTGSRDESHDVEPLVDKPAQFDEEFARVIAWASENRAAVQRAAESVFGPLKLLLDLPHNTYEALSDGSVVIWKGAVRVQPGELNIIPSHIDGGAVLVRATARVAETLLSLSHGTGRTMPRGESKALAGEYDFAALRLRVLMPSRLDDSSLRTDGPYAYRDLDECLQLLDGYVEVVTRFKVIAYIGHLK